MPKLPVQISIILKVSKWVSILRYRYPRLVSELGIEKYRFLKWVSWSGIEKYRYLNLVSKPRIEKYRYLKKVSIPNTKVKGHVHLLNPRATVENLCYKRLKISYQRPILSRNDVKVRIPSGEIKYLSFIHKNITRGNYYCENKKSPI